jgi:hypothetical protein
MLTLSVFGRIRVIPSGRALAFAMALGAASLGTTLGGCELVRHPTDPLQMRVLAKDEVGAFDRAAIGAVVERLRGGDSNAIAADLLVAGSDKIEPESKFRYDGFALLQVKFLDRSNGDSGLRHVSALLHFEDPAGRRAASLTDLTYRKTDGGIELTEAAWAPIYPANPRTAMFVVPADALIAAKAEAMKDYRSLYRFALLNGFPMHGEAPVAVAAETKVILVFLRDRIEPGADFAVRISDRRGSHDGYEAATRYAIFDGGWAVAMVPGDFPLDPDRAFWVKAVYRPGPVAAESTGWQERLVGLYSSAPVAKP